MIGALCSRRVIVGLGSNLGDRAASLTRAVARLAAHPAISIEARSSVVATAALTEPGAAAQPEFFNAAVRLRTTLAPEALLDVLLDTERALGRVRNERWGARTIDLDVLWITGETLHTERLDVPHPGLSARSFALFPLLEVLGADDPGGPALRSQSLLLEPPRCVGTLAE